MKKKIFQITGTAIVSSVLGWILWVLYNELKPDNKPAYITGIILISVFIYCASVLYEEFEIKPSKKQCLDAHYNRLKKKK